VASSADIYIAAKKGLVEYRQIFLPTPGDVAPAKFHYEWSLDLLTGDKHTAFEGYRESGKGSIILRAFPLYTLTFPSEKWRYMVIIKSNMAQARKALKTIVSEYMNNPFINARMVKVLKNTSDVFEVVLDCGGKNMTVLIEVYGKGASIRGLNNKDVRPTILLIDDPQDSSDMKSEVVPDNDWEWFLGDVMFLGQTARIFMIGNNLGERCIIERVARNADNLGFKFKRIPCANADLTESAWPEKQGIEEILKERADYIAVGELDVWLREKMCLSTSEETKIFKEEDFRYFTPLLIERMCQEAQEVFATLDPASSERSNSCFRAIVVCARMKDGHWYIVDVPYGRWNSYELINQMFATVRKFGIRRFGVEKGMFKQVIEPFIYKEMTRRGVRFDIIPIEHAKQGSKLERIKMLQPRFKAHTVWFPDNAEWLDEMKMELAGVTNNDIKSMFIDLVDGMAMLEQLDVRHSFVLSEKQYNKKLPRFAIR